MNPADARPAELDPGRAWAPFEPNGADPWDLPRVAHLHRRAGFAAPWAILQRDLHDGPAAAVDRLLDGEPVAGDGTPAPAFESLLARMADQLAPDASLPQLQGVWLYRMIFTPHPLRERMTLFWHGHFATSHAKVQNSWMMQRQNDLLRRHALGRFPALLAAIGKDPAMLVWLDSTANRKAHPNENYAREVMELFTLGRGHYTEKDVQEAARAFTGWFIVRDHFREEPAQHDDGLKTMLGQTGPWDGDDVPRILLDQPACAQFLCRKLVRHFVDETATYSDAFIEPLARSFRESGFDLRVPIRAILRSNLFFDPSVRRRRVKGPVEYAVGTIRALEVLKPTVKAEALAESCSRMGQSLFAPPSVAGWSGGPAWINSTTMLARANLALGLLSPNDPALGKRLDAQSLAERHGSTGPREAARFLIDLLVQDAFAPNLRDRILAVSTKTPDPKPAAREAATLVLTSPEYQLG